MRRTEFLVAAAASLAVAILWTLPVSLDPAGSAVDGGDPLHLAWVMAWDAHQLVRAPWRLFASNTFYPYPQSLAFGDHLLPQALLVAPVNWLTGNAILASNAALLLGLSGAAFAMYVLLRTVTGSRAAGAAAGACWAFNSFTHFELARVQVLQLQWWPLALLALVRAVGTASPATTRAFAVLVILQGLSSSYYMVYSALVAPLWWLSAYAAVRRRPSPAEVRALVTTLLGALPVVLALSWPYLAGDSRAWREKDLARGLDVLAFVTRPGRAVPGWPGPVTGFASAFVGYATLALAAAAVLRARRWTPAARALAACAAVAVAVGLMLSLGPDVTVAGRTTVPGPYRALVAIAPFLKAMDGTQRASVLVRLGLSLLAGLGTAWLDRLRRFRVPAAALLVVLLVAEHASRPAAAYAVPTGARVPPVYRALAAEDGPVVELPLLPREDRRYWSSYLYFSTHHWRPIPFGRTSFYPPAHDLLAEDMADFPSPASLGILQRLGVTTVVVHPLAWPASVRAERLAALETEPSLQRLATFPALGDARYAWLALGEERLYRLASGPEAAAPCEPAEPVARTAFTVTGKPRPATVNGRALRERWRFDFAADGDLRTSFATDRPQMPGDVLDVQLAVPQRIAAVTLAMGRRYAEFPRGLAVLGADAAGVTRWLRVADGPAERWADARTFLDGRDARLTLRLNPRDLRRLQLLLRGEPDGTLPEWSVAEIGLFGACR